MQMRGLQAQLADARQQQKVQAAEQAALQARLQAANDQATAHDADKTKLQVSCCQCCVLTTNNLHCALWGFLEPCMTQATRKMAQQVKNQVVMSAGGTHQI